MRVSATGGAALAVTMLGPQQQGHILPHFLPDGRRFLFSVWGPADIGGIYLGALDGSAPARLAPEVGAGLYLPEGTGLAGAFRKGGWLLWVREGTLVAQRLDVAKPALTGEPVTVAERVIVDDYSFRSSVSVAATGLVAYRSGEGTKRQLAWFDRSGTAQGTIGDADATLRLGLRNQVFEGPSHAVGDERRERRDIHVDARPIQCGQISVPILDANDRPGIAARRQHRVHHEARYPSVPVRVRMDVAKQPVPEHSADARVRFVFQEVEQFRHRIPYGFPPWRHVARRPQIDGIVSVARERGGRNDARGHAWLEQLAIPVHVRRARARAGIRTRDDL